MTCAYVASSPDATPSATGQSITTTVGSNGQFPLITGQATDASTGDPIGGIPVTVVTDVRMDGSEVVTSGTTGSTTDNAGDYAVILTADTNWNVLFGSYLGGPDYTPTYTSCPAFCGYEEQWYADALTYDTSTPVTVTGNATTAGINGSLTPIPANSP